MHNITNLFVSPDGDSETLGWRMLVLKYARRSVAVPCGMNQHRTELYTSLKSRQPDARLLPQRRQQREIRQIHSSRVTQTRRSGRPLERALIKCQHSKRQLEKSPQVEFSLQTLSPRTGFRIWPNLRRHARLHCDCALPRCTAVVRLCPLLMIFDSKTAAPVGRCSRDRRGPVAGYRRRRTL
jgi:hypothetical protein